MMTPLQHCVSVENYTRESQWSTLTINQTLVRDSVDICGSNNNIIPFQYESIVVVYIDIKLKAEWFFFTAMKM